MRSVAMETLKTRVDEYLRAAEAGETVLVTEDGRVVAELVPPRNSAHDVAILERGRREGWYSPPENEHWQPLPEPGPDEEADVSFDQVLDDLRLDRDSR